MTDTELIEAFRPLAAATVFEGAGKVGGMAPDIRPLQDGMRLIGTAFTVRCATGDLTAMIRAVDAARPGDVLVIEGAGLMTTWGGGATVAALFRKLAGVVTNGCVRDAQQIRDLGFPVFCRGISVRGGLRNHPGWTGIAVSVGEVVVHPGDLVIGDIDGVTVVARDDVEAVLAKSLTRRAHEEKADRVLASGTPYGVWTGVTRPDARTT